MIKFNVQCKGIGQSGVRITFNDVNGNVIQEYNAMPEKKEKEK